MTIRKIAAIFVLFAVAATTVFAGGDQEPQANRSRRDREVPRLEEAVPNVVEDLDGYVVRTAAHWPGPSRDLIVGQAQLDAWDEVEDEFNIEREWIEMPNPSQVVEKMTATVLLGEPFADIIWLNSSDAIPALVEANMILPLDDYIDYDDPRWPHQNRELAEYNGKMYGVLPWMLAGGSGIWYNRTLFQREGFPDLHELVDRGEWTWEKYLEIARAATKDTDGDGEVDQWGITVGYEIEYPLISSNGATVVRETSDGRYEFALDEPAGIEALDFIAELYRSDTISYDGEQLFIAGRAAMYGGEVFQGNNMLLNMQDDYGFVYYPKGPSVDDYRSVAGGSAMMAIPANVNYPPERLGEIITQTTPFDVMRQVQLEFLEGNFRFQQDIDRVFEMIDRTTFTRTGNFPGLKREIGRIFREIRQGASAATAVEQYAQPAQAAIDAVFR